MTGDILTLNAGSSSVKFAVYDTTQSDRSARITGKIEGIGRAPAFSARDASGTAVAHDHMADLPAQASHETLIACLLEWLSQHCDERPLLAVGHRVVHGGTFFSAPVLITDDVLDKLETLVPLAPLHQSHSLAAIRAVANWRSDLQQVACFDTGFHHTQPRLATLFALPRELTDEGILRYGFHGLSYDYISGALPTHLGTRASGRVIVAHLGNGASMCAIENGKSVATSMGFTALDGLMMGRRCGTLDPGVILYLMQSKGMDAGAIENLLYRQSGLLGVSGVSNNMKDLEASDAPSAREAIDLYVYRAARTLAGLVPTIGGLDAVVFTGGIGENSAHVRAAICAQLTWLGVEINDAANDMNAIKISAKTSTVDVMVLPTDEESIIATACRCLLGFDQATNDQDADMTVNGLG